MNRMPRSKHLECLPSVSGVHGCMTCYAAKEGEEKRQMVMHSSWYIHSGNHSINGPNFVISLRLNHIHLSSYKDSLLTGKGPTGVAFILHYMKSEKTTLTSLELFFFLRFSVSHRVH